MMSRPRSWNGNAISRKVEWLFWVETSPYWFSSPEQKSLYHGCWKRHIPLGEKLGLNASARRTESPDQKTDALPYILESSSLDSSGIVHSVAALLRRHTAINIADLETNTVPAPWDRRPAVQYACTTLHPPYRLNSNPAPRRWKAWKTSRTWTCASTPPAAPPPTPDPRTRYGRRIPRGTDAASRAARTPHPARHGCRVALKTAEFAMRTPPARTPRLTPRRQLSYIYIVPRSGVPPVSTGTIRGVGCRWSAVLLTYGKNFNCQQRQLRSQLRKQPERGNRLRRS